VAWKVAVVKLKQAQALLAEECGFHLPPGCRDACPAPLAKAAALSREQG
jgi:hypothetical protein